jgi:glycosyltransferase involved in cell wall biosynthesis
VLVAMSGSAVSASEGAAGARGYGSPPRFSVIVNVYNGEVFLRETIDSVLAQSFGDFELILWDDCSTDRSVEICASYRDPRIRCFRAAERVSIAQARARAVEMAVGDWLAFVDQDDIWLPEKLAAQNGLIKADPSRRVALVYGLTICFASDGRRALFDRWHSPDRLPEGAIFVELLRRPSFIALSSAVIRRDAFIELCALPPYVTHCPDYYFFLSICRHYDVARVPDPCCLYRLHPDSMSHVYRKEIHEEALRIIEAAAEPAHRHILRTRRRIHHTLIAIEDLRTRDSFGRGLRRLVLQGSLAYLLVRPLLMFGRRLRVGMTGRRAAGEPFT